MACVDKAPATAEYKLLQLRQYLTGEALKSTESLGYSATAYEAAKDCGLNGCRELHHDFYT